VLDENVLVCYLKIVVFYLMYCFIKCTYQNIFVVSTLDFLIKILLSEGRNVFITFVSFEHNLV